MLNVIYSCDDTIVLSASLRQSSVSRDPSEIILMRWFGAQNYIIVNVKNSWKVPNNYIFLNIDVLAVNFSQFNASLLNKSIHFLSQTFKQ